MKRFWKAAAAVEADDGWTVRLDERPLLTPGRAPLAVPTRALAEAIAGEWAVAQEMVEPRSMPLTGLANAAIDRISTDRSAFAAGLAKYAEADLACYRSQGPETLAARQRDSWDSLLGWARRRYDIDFAVTTGIVHAAQPKATVERLAQAVAELDVFRLAGMAPLVTIGGSLVAALAVLDGAMSADEAWDSVSIDERWQVEKWGADVEAEAAIANRRRDFLAAAQFLELLDA